MKSFFLYATCYRFIPLVRSNCWTTALNNQAGVINSDHRTDVDMILPNSNLNIIFIAIKQTHKNMSRV